jgi:hypothetical protein
MSDVDRITPNDAVAFLVEVAALVVLGAWGWNIGRSIGDTTVWAAIGAAVVVAVAAGLWGLFAAPRSRFDVLAMEVTTKVVVLGGSVLAARTLLAPAWWWVYALVVVANTVLLYVGPWAR